MGYHELNPTDHANSEEPDITGELVRVMREILERDSSPDWVEYYSIHDDPPLNVPDRQGRRRPRVDIEIERVNRGPRPRLRFEAKRLGTQHLVGPYLGDDGLGCFTSGMYPLTHPEAGMLGYVQSDDEASWAAKIETALRRAPARYSTTKAKAWGPYQITAQLAHTYRSRHNCQAIAEELQIFHILLRLY
jgi:hypothetical protein